MDLNSEVVCINFKGTEIKCLTLSLMPQDWGPDLRLALTLAMGVLSIDTNYFCRLQIGEGEVTDQTWGLKMSKKMRHLLFLQEQFPY